MASIINASSTGSGGIVQTADASGVLVLQSNGTAALTTSGANLTVGGLLTFQGTTLPTAGTASIFNRSSDSTMYLQAATGGGINLLDGSQNSMATLASSSVQLLTGNVARMTINSSGYVRTPYQPMFSVYKANGSVTGNSSGVQVVYNSVQVNVSSSYDTGNGYFTAPIAGTYYFSAMGMASSVTGNYDLQLQIQVNGSSIAISNPPVANSTQQGINFACSCMATLAAGDSVRVVYYSSTATVFYAGGGAFNNFSGFLVG